MRKSGTITYGSTTISVTRSQDGIHVEAICLDDLCKILRTPVLVSDQANMEKYPSMVRADDDKTYVSILDALEFISSFRKSRHRKLIIEKLTTLLTGINTIIFPRSLSVSAEEDGTIPVIYQENRFTAKVFNGRLIFNVTDMGKAHDKSPEVWRSLSRTRQLMETLVREGNAPDMECLYVNTNEREIWLDHTLLIDYGRWISDEFGIWCDGILMKLFTEGSVSLEEITPELIRASRKVQYQPRPFLPPATSTEAYQLCEEQHYIIEEMRPKALYYDTQVNEREWFPNSFIANELGVTIRRLNSFLEEEGVHVKKAHKWEITGKFRGIPLKMEVPYENDEAKNPYNMRSVWTPYGRDYIHEIWKLRNG